MLAGWLRRSGGRAPRDYKSSPAGTAGRKVMARLQLHLLCFVLGVHQYVGDYVQVLLGEPFTLCGNCKTAERCKLQRVQLNGIREVAVHEGGMWRPAPGYQSRISENSSVVFIRAVYTDTGVYELTRSGQVVTIHLDVVVGFEASVTEGSALSLPCFYSTTGSTCWSVRWVKDGDVVLEHYSCIDKSTADAADRLSLSADWLPHGDLSLNLQPVRREDEGNYFCYIQARGGLKQRGNPAAVRLKVSERGADQIVSTAPPPPVSPTEKASAETPMWAALTITAVVGVIVGFLGGCWLKSCRSAAASRGG